MKPLTREWVRKAEADFATALRELRARKSPNYDAACFHAQQCIEKYMKAVLQESRTRFGRTHDLVALLDLLVPAEPGLEMLRPSLDVLTRYAVVVRYPGETAHRSTAKEAVALCGSARATIRAILKLRS